MSKPTRRITIVLLVLVMLIIGGVLVLPWIVNRPAVLEILSRGFEQRTGFSLSVEAWQVRFFPSIGLELVQPQVQDPGSTTPLLQADRLEVALQWLSLFEGQVVVKDLVIDRPRLTIRRSIDGTWSLAGSAPAAASDESSPPFAFLQVVRNLLIVDGVITVIDDSSHTPRAPIHVAVTQGTLSSEMLGRHARLQISGEIPQARDRAAFSWDGSLTQNQDGNVQAAGDFRLHHLDVRHVVSSWAGGDGFSDGFSGLARLTAHLRWSPRPDGHELIADEWRAELGEMSIQGMATVRGLGTEHPTFSSAMSAAPVSFVRLLRDLPSAWIPAPLRAQFIADGLDGLITLQSLSVSGAIASGSRPAISGVIEIRNGRMTWDPQYLSLEEVSATLSYDAAHMRITDLRAQWGPLRLKGEELLITQWTTDPHLDMKILGTAPVAGLLEAARRMDGFPLMRNMLTGIEQATGDVEMLAHVTGHPAGGKPLTLVDLDVRLSRGGFRSSALPEPVRAMEARIHAKPSLVAIEYLEGWVGPAKFDVHGMVSLEGRRAYSDVQVQMSADVSEARSWFVKSDDGDVRPDMEGNVQMQAAVTGPGAALRFKGKIDLENTALRLPNRLTKPLHAPAVIEFDGWLSNGSRLIVRQLAVRFPPIKIVGDGTIDLSGDMEFGANISSGAVSVSKLPQGVTLGPISAGTLDVTLHVEGHMKDRASWQTAGEIQFDRGRIVVEGMREPIHEAFVTLRFDQDNIQIPRMAFRVGASDVRVSGSIEHWADSPKARLLVESSQIDIAAFRQSDLSPPHSVGRRSPDSAWWSDMTLHAFLFIDHVYYKKLLLTGLSVRLVWDHGLLTVDRISGDTNEGSVAGQVKIRATGGWTEQARSTFRASGIPVEQVLDLVQARGQGEEKPALTGWLTTSGKLQAKFERAGLSVGAITSRQPIQILVEDGRMYHVPVISTLLALMNLPALLQGQLDLDKGGLPIDRLKLVFSINNGVIDAKEFLLDSPILKISGTGRYDILADDFDMVLATSPLGSYSALLKRIPLFGQLLAGDRQGFDTAVFELKGSAHNPALRYLPTQSLMTGVKGTAQLAFDILVNALTLPQKAYTMVEDKIAESEEDDF